MFRLIALVAVATAAAPAEAQRWRDGQFVSVGVPIEDLDLSTAAGVREMDRRIGRAVNRICGSDRACRDDAWWSTEDQAASAIARDERMRRLAEEREAELEACGPYGCRGRVEWGAADDEPLPPPVPYGSTTVTIHIGAPPPQGCCRR